MSRVNDWIMLSGTKGSRIIRRDDIRFIEVDSPEYDCKAIVRCAHDGGVETGLSEEQLSELLCFLEITEIVELGAA